MQSDRDLFKQALNVLENRAPDHSVTKALHERLAQPEQYQRPTMRRATREEKIDRPGVYWVPVEQEQDRNCADQRDCDGRCCIKQPEQEPVAWQYSFTHSSAIGHGDYDVGPLVTDKKDVAFGVGCFGQLPLYPPRREPELNLNDKSVQKRLAAQWGYVTEQEPVAHLWQHSETGRTRIVMPDQIITADASWFVVGPLYLATPPRREWVGLTEEEIDPITQAQWGWNAHGLHAAHRAYARAIEAKLREKNT